MKVTAIMLWRLALTSHDTYYMADGKVCDTLDSLILRLDTDEGLSGWGEVCPIPHYLPAYADGVLPAVREMAPLVLGADPVGPEALTARLDAHLQGHGYAKSALDIAFWDLAAKAAGLPLYRLLGGRRAVELPLYHSITCIAPETMAEMAREAQSRGIAQFQVKLGADADWLADVARLRLVREAVGPGPLVYGDWNCGATKLEATRVGRAVADIDVMLEQPCQTLADCAAVRQATGLPMKIDENATDLKSLLEAAQLGCLDAVAIKTSKFGGLSAARRARDLAQYLGARMCIEDTWGTDIVTTASLHLGTATAPAALLNVCDLSGYVAPRLDPRGPTRRNGSIAVGEAPGLGLDPDLGLLGEPIAIFD